MAYNSTYPLSQRAQYFPNESVDFVLNFAGKQIISNSVALTGRLVVYKNGDSDDPATLEVADSVFYDGHVGAHALFQNLVTSFSDRVVESFNHYPRYIKSVMTANKASENSTALSSDACQLTTFDQEQPNEAGAIVECPTSRSVMILPDTSKGRAFCVIPDIALNNCFYVSDKMDKNGNPLKIGGIPWSVSGEVKLTVQLSSVNQILYGEDVDANVSYYLTDLELVYRTVPDPMATKVVNYTYKQSLKQIISSNNQALNFKTPIPTNTMYATFIKTASENDVTKDYLQMDPLEGLSRVDWSINDLNQGILEYPLENYEEIKLNYLMAVRGLDDSTVEQMIEPVELLAENKIRGVGLNYLSVLANTKVSVNILSDASNIDQYSAYFYFIGQSGFSSM